MVKRDSNSNSSSEITESALKRRNTLLFYILLGLAVALSLLPGRGRITFASRPPVMIKMVDMPPVFEPTRVTIAAGDSVDWQNVGNEVHHATSDPALAIQSTDVSNPSGVRPFDSGFLRPGESFSHAFLKPGVYRYTCVVHEAKGMIGEIVVK